MLLVVDCGNTQTVIGLYEDPGGSTELVDHWRLSTNAERTSDELALLVQEFLGFHGYRFEDDVHGLSVSSGVPRVTAALRDMARRYFGTAPLVVIEPGVRTGMPILYENPREVGADRIANAVGALERHKPPMVVVDFGTATTFDAISAKGEYLGGAIVPGVEISLDALYARAARLFRVELSEPRAVIGRTTSESIQSGAIYGYSALVDGLVRRMEDELGPSTVIATGGLAGVIGPLCATIQHLEPELTLVGLRSVFERNQS
ncbi:MAG: type III pantothenate kinase [Acidimicrobiia bacterium]|nr:type III pantothenate kinase [Acidimicrobiia bacterium]